MVLCLFKGLCHEMKGNDIENLKPPSYEDFGQGLKPIPPPPLACFGVKPSLPPASSFLRCDSEESVLVNHPVWLRLARWKCDSSTSYPSPSSSSFRHLGNNFLLPKSSVIPLIGGEIGGNFDCKFYLDYWMYFAFIKSEFNIVNRRILAKVLKGIGPLDRLQIGVCLASRFRAG